MGRPAAPREGQEPRRASGARFLLAIAALLVLGGLIGLAVYVRSAAKRDDPARPDVVDPAGPTAPSSAAAGASSPARAGARPAPARRGEPSESAPAGRGAGSESAPELSGPAPGAPEGSASVPAEDRFLGGSSPPPASADPAPAPPDPPRAPLAPAPAPVDDPRDFDVDPRAATPH